MNKVKFGARCLLGVSAMAMIVAAVPAAAQGAPVDAAEQEEGEPSAEAIIVTGRKMLDSGASSASKMDIPVLETPFSVNAYNDNFLDAIETQNVSDLYRYMTGIQRAGNTGYDISFRGFKTGGTDRNAILTDGLPGLSVRIGSPPTIGVERVELVKGGTSVLYGQAQPGGFINIITKKPEFKPGYQVDLKGIAGAGKYDRALGGTISVDLTGPLDSADRFAFRMIGEIGRIDGFRDFSNEKPVYFAPSLAWKLGDRTKVTVQGEYRRVKVHYDTYLVAPNRDVSLIADITTAYQEPEDVITERGLIGSVFFGHEFSSDINFRLGYRYVDQDSAQTSFDVLGFRDTANTIVTRRARGQDNERTYSFVDANLTAKLDTFGIQHTLLVGFTGGQETTSLNRTQFYNCSGAACNSLDVSVYNPVHGVVPRPSAFPLFNPGQMSNLTWRYTVQNSLGFYASDFIEFSDMFKAMVGVRYADERQSIEDLRLTTFVPVKKKDTRVLPMAGLIFQPKETISIYSSYSTSFVPVAATAQDNFGNNPFSPTTANSIEAGIKAELFDRKVTVTSAVFDIKKKNTLNTFNCLTQAQLIAAGIAIPPGATIASGTCSNQLGGERSKGFEIEFNGTPLPGWSLTGGYAFTNAKVTSSNIAVQNGARLTNSPRNSFNLWSRYDFESGPLENLGFGLGLAYVGNRAGLLPTQANDPRPGGGTMPLGSYFTVDLGIYYEPIENLNITLKATNLLDERYIENSGFAAELQTNPGTPRQLTATVRYKF